MRDLLGEAGRAERPQAEVAPRLERDLDRLVQLVRAAGEGRRLRSRERVGRLWDSNTYGLSE